MPEDLAYAGIEELHAGGAPAPAVVELLLERIARLDAPGTATELRSILAVCPTAVADAHEAAVAGAGTGGGGPLQGIPVLVKDNIEVAGMPSCAGSTSLVGRPAQRDAPLVARLRQAGAVIVGTTNLSEWANIRDHRSTSGWSAVGGLTRNPWALDRSAGGSSSGSGAAVAAGLAPVAVGTETDGSIICPAALNGLVGLKPAVGAVPGAGIVPISSSQDSAGPMGRSSADVAVLYEVLAGVPGIAARVAEGVRGLRIGVVRSWMTGHDATDAAFEGTVRRLAGLVATGGLRDVHPPTEPSSVRQDKETVMLTELASGLASYLPTRGATGPQDLAEVIDHERAHADVELAWFGHGRFLEAVALPPPTADRYRSARRRCLSWARDRCLGPALGDVDLIVAPAYGPAWKVDLTLGDQLGVEAHATGPAAMAGWPIATAPVGTVDGLPVGITALGRPGAEALLLAACGALEVVGRPSWRPVQTG